MWPGYPLFPEAASTIAGQIDALYFYLVAVSTFFTLLIFGLLTVFAIRYRQKEGVKARQIFGDLRLEAVWTIVPLLLVLSFFGWGAKIFFEVKAPPPDALEVYVVGKQWMWKIQHPEGPREINELHVPVGQPVKLTMATEDVIHSFYVPAFRIKQDVVPGRYTTTWFEATRTGEYHLFCAEYCGTSHSVMTGKVVVMEPEEYQQWLSGGAAGEPLAVAGERLFNELGCNTCHAEDPSARGPALQELYGTPVQLRSGRTVVADESYIRESILDPGAQVVAGYDVLMPTYEGQIGEEGLLQLIAYIRSLGPKEGSPASGGSGGSAQADSTQADGSER